MIHKFKPVAFAGALLLLASPVLADDMALPKVDIDPFHILTPAPAAAPEAAPMKKHHMMKHHMMKHHSMKHHMMKHHMKKK